MPRSACGRDFVDHDAGEQGDEEAVEEEAGLDGVVEDLVDGLDILIPWRMENNNHTAYQTNSTPKLAEDSQFFFEEIRSENGANQYGQGAERSHEDCWSEGVGGEVKDFAENHGYDAAPPSWDGKVFETVVFAVVSAGGHEAEFCYDEGCSYSSC